MATEVLKITADTSDLEKKLKVVDKELDEINSSAKKAGTSIDDGLKKGEKRTTQLQKNTKGLNKAFVALGGVVAATFAVSKISDFITKSVELAGQLQGVKQAFDQLNNPTLLSNLRKATRGTVTDLELMKQAVKANNFKVPLEKLATFFDFATKRAAQTGESVDYLTNSIVDGIGRKSTLVLDNLGISATELQEEIKLVGDFGIAAGNIIEREVGKMGDVAETSAQKTAKLNATLENLSATIGTRLSPVVSAFAEGLDSGLNDAFDVIESDAISAGQAFDFLIAKFADVTGAGSLYAQRIKDRATIANAELEKQAEIMAGIGATLNKITTTADENTVSQKGIVEALNEQIKAVDELINTTPSQERLNELLRERLALQTQLAAVKSPIVDEDVSFGEGRDDFNDFGFDTGEVGDSFIEEQERVTSEASEIWEAYYQEQLSNQAASLDEQTKNSEAKAEYEMTLEDQKNAALLNASSQLFGALRGLLKDHAEAQKALAVFEVALNAYVAIQQALASGPPPANFILAAVVGVAAAAQIVNVATTNVPSFYEGTDYLELGKNKKGRDTIPVMAHEGEAIIPSGQNSKYPGLAKAWINDDLDKYIRVSHVIPALKKQQAIQAKEKSALLSHTLGGAFNAELNDSRIVNRLRNQEYILEEIATSVRNNRRVNPHRA